MKKLLLAVLLSASALLVTACKTEGNPSTTETDCNHIEVTDDGYAATCTEPGMSDGSHCSVCGIVIKEQSVIQPTGHSFDEWKVIMPVSCTENGEQEHTCSSCGFSEKQSVTALGHSFSDEWTIDVPATCTQVGSKSHGCIRCSEKIDITEIPMSEHVIVIDSAVAATCKKSGLTEGKHCAVCNLVITAQTKTTGKHKYSEYKCSVCGKLQSGHQADYLRNWVEKNGTVNGEAVLYHYYSFKFGILTFAMTDDKLVIGLSNSDDDISLTTIMTVDPKSDGKYDCYFSFEQFDIYFLVNPNGFTKNTPITVTASDFPSEVKNDAAELARQSFCQLLDAANAEFKTLNIGMTIADLGFTSYK